MTLRITAMVERWPVAGQFIIARGEKTYVDVLLVAVSDGVSVFCRAPSNPCCNPQFIVFIAAPSPCPIALPTTGFYHPLLLPLP